MKYAERKQQIIDAIKDKLKSWWSKSEKDRFEEGFRAGVAYADDNPIPDPWRNIFEDRMPDVYFVGHNYSNLDIERAARTLSGCSYSDDVIIYPVGMPPVVARLNWEADAWQIDNRRLISPYKAPFWMPIPEPTNIKSYMSQLGIKEHEGDMIIHGRKRELNEFLL